MLATFSKSKIGLKIVKIKISKNRLWHKLPTTQTNRYTKFYANPSITLVYIAILGRTENGEQTQIFLLQFLTPRGLKRTQKKFQRDRKKNHRPYSNICHSGLRTYKKKLAE